MGKRAAVGAPPVSKAKAKAKTAAASTALVQPEPMETHSVNAELQAFLASCDAEIKSYYGSALDEVTSFCGAQPFDKKLAMSCLAANGRYKCALPFFALDTMWEAQPNVPRYRSRIDSLRDHFFADPNVMDEALVVPVEQGAALDGKFRGTLQSISPPEMLDALRVAVAEDIRNKVPKSRLKQWLGVLQSTHVQFEAMQGNRMDKVFSSLVQGRENICVKCENTRVSSLLRVYEIMDFKRQLSKIGGGPGKEDKKASGVSVAALVEKYKGISFAKMSEPVSATFIEYAVGFYNNALSYPDVAAVLQRFDQLANNPIDSIYKYRLVMLGCEKQRDKMLWVYSFLFDHFEHVTLMKAVAKRGDDAKSVKESVPLRSLQDGAVEHVSYVRLFLMKRSLREHLLRFMD